MDRDKPKDAGRAPGDGDEPSLSEDDLSSVSGGSTGAAGSEPCVDCPLYVYDPVLPN